MRCPECNKFVSYDTDSVEPEVEVEVDEGGNVTGTVRIVLTCAEDGSTELKETTFDIDGQVTPKFATDHAGEGHELSVEADEFTTTTEMDPAEVTHTLKSGKVVTRRVAARYRKTYYGYDGDVTVTCECGESESVHLHDRVSASGMDEMT